MRPKVEVSVRSEPGESRPLQQLNVEPPVLSLHTPVGRDKESPLVLQQAVHVTSNAPTTTATYSACTVFSTCTCTTVRALGRERNVMRGRRLRLLHVRHSEYRAGIDYEVCTHTMPATVTIHTPKPKTKKIPGLSQCRSARASCPKYTTDPLMIHPASESPGPYWGYANAFQ